MSVFRVLRERGSEKKYKGANFFFAYLCASKGRKSSTELFKTALCRVFFFFEVEKRMNLEITQKLIMTLGFAVIVYCIWQECNIRIFAINFRCPNSIFNQVEMIIYDKIDLVRNVQTT